MSDRRSRPYLVDGGIALLLAGIGVAEIWVPFTSVQGEGSRGTTTVVVVLVTLALTLRRVTPLPTAVFVLLAWPVVFTVTPLLVLFWGQFVPMVLAVFSVARHGAGRQGVYGALVGAGTLLFLDFRVDVLQAPGEIVFHWLVFVVAWSVGRGLHVMERRAEESVRRAIEVEVASAERAMAAVVEERTRIARELHDVVAHSVSVMVIQAGAAEQVVEDDPERARAALRTIRVTGTEALTEMRRVVAMLREAGDTGALSPQPGLDQLHVLVEEARTGGLDVNLTVTGRSAALPAGLDLAAYRILQEALTNVRRHADASHAEVRVGYESEALVLEVRDDGRRPAQAAAATPQHQPAGAPAPGHGLIGMRERVGLYGGRLDAGPGPGGGYRVHAVLPLAGGGEVTA